MSEDDVAASQAVPAAPLIHRRVFLRRLATLWLASASLALLDACSPAPTATPTSAAPPAPPAATSGATAAAPRPTTAAAQVARGTTVLTVGHEADVPNLDPGQSLGLNSLRVQRLITESLVTTKPTSGEIVPLLAESWETSPDGKEWTFHLRSGVQFSDGTPFTAESVKQTFERTVIKDNPYYKTGQWSFVVGYLDPLEQAVVVNDTTLKLQLKYPLASLLAYLALPNLSILSLKAIQEAGSDIGTKPVGTGPYVLTAYERGTRIELTRNERYWGQKGKPDTIVFRPFTEDQARVAALLSGGADVIIPVPPDSIAPIQSSGKALVVEVPGLTSWYVSLNTNKKPLDDRRVRQALNYAIDKQAIVRDVLKDTGSVAQGPTPKSSWAFNSQVQTYDYDPGRAKQLLTEAGYPNGFAVDFWVPDSGSGMQEPKPMATVIQANLADVGVRANLQVLEWGSYLGKLRQQTPDLAALSWFLKSDDPDLSLFPNFYSKNAPLPNSSGYNSPEMDKLLVDARSATQQEQRVQLYHQVLETLTTDAPWIFIDHEKEIIGVRQGVDGVVINPNGYDLRVENAVVGS